MTEQEFLKSVGLKIRELRKKSGMTQDEVAVKAGIYRANLSALELGKETIKSIDIIRRIVEATGHTMKDVFLPLDEEPTKEITEKKLFNYPNHAAGDLERQWLGRG